MSDSYAWAAVIREAALRPWLQLVEDDSGVREDMAANRERLDQLIQDLQIARLDGLLSEQDYEICVEGSRRYFSDECRLTLLVLNQNAWMDLAGIIIRAMDEWGPDRREELTIEIIHPAEQPGGQITAIRFRYYTRIEFQLFCQILMVAFQEIPV